MTPELEALARRAVACRGWRWMTGMVDQHTRLVLDVNDGRYASVPVWWTDAIACDVVEMYESPKKASKEWSDALPDLTDPATLGCLLALVREAWGQPSATTLAHRGRWYVVYEDVDASSWLAACMPTEAEALVAALEAAP